MAPHRNPRWQPEDINLQRCRHHIMHIRWWQNITNMEVLAHANITTISTMVRTSRLRWLGHVCCMSDHRLPKRRLFVELATGSCPHGRLCKHWKDVTKEDLKIFNVEGNWHDLTQIRKSWREQLFERVHCLQRLLLLQRQHSSTRHCTDGSNVTHRHK